jgi:predicted ABC-type ATPase
LAALIADFIRNKLLENNIDFSFETVMSHKSKIEILLKAKAIGFRIILIFVTTKNPQINLARVKKRVSEGGHNVPEDKIISRYYNCMELLYDALIVADEALIFDNSIEFTKIDDSLVAQKFENKITLGKYKYDWFEKYVIDKIPKK